jgi:Tol biopolymer transport system component
MDQNHPRSVVLRNAWWAVLACVVCLVVYILGCVMSRPSWSPDSSRVALLVTAPGDDPDLYALFTYDVRAGIRHLLDRVRADGLLSAPAWSPDGKWIAYYRVEPNVPTPGASEPNLAAASPSGPATAGPLAAAEAILPDVLWDLAKEQVDEKAERAVVKVMLVSPDAGEPKTLCVTQWMAKRKDLSRLMIMGPAWSKDSRHLFYADAVGDLFSISDLEMATGRTQTLLLSSTGSATPSPDGQWVATLLAARSKQVCLVAARADGRTTRYVKLGLELDKQDDTDLSLLSEVSWSADSKRVLVSMGAQMLVANVLTGEGRVYADARTEDVAFGAFAPAGETIYYVAGPKKEGGKQDVELRTFNVANGKTRTVAVLSSGVELKTSGVLTVAPSGKAAIFRCTTQDAAGKERGLLILWDGKNTQRIETDPWLADLPG